VIPNRGDVTHLGATKIRQGCRQFLIYCLLIDILVHMMPKIIIFNQVRVRPNLFKDLKGATKQKRLKNTGVERYFPLQIV
jgi:hypothetical protein